MPGIKPTGGQAESSCRQCHGRPYRGLTIIALLFPALGLAARALGYTRAPLPGGGERPGPDGRGLTFAVSHRPSSPAPEGAGRVPHQANGRASGIVLSTMPRPPLPGLDDNCPPVPSAWPCGPRTGLYTCPPYRGAGDGPSVAVLGQARAGVGTGTCPSSSEPVLGPGRGRTYVAPGEAPSNPGYPVPLSHRPREGPDVTGAQPTGDANETIISKPHGRPSRGSEAMGHPLPSAWPSDFALRASSDKSACALGYTRTPLRGSGRTSQT